MLLVWFHEQSNTLIYDIFTNDNLIQFPSIWLILNEMNILFKSVSTILNRIYLYYLIYIFFRHPATSTMWFIKNEKMHLLLISSINKQLKLCWLTTKEESDDTQTIIIFAWMNWKEFFKWLWWHRDLLWSCLRPVVIKP